MSREREGVDVTITMSQADESTSRDTVLAERTSSLHQRSYFHIHVTRIHGKECTGIFLAHVFSRLAHNSFTVSLSLSLSLHSTTSGDYYIIPTCELASSYFLHKNTILLIYALSLMRENH